MSSLTILLPKPPGLNHVYRVSPSGVTYMAPTARKYKAEAGQIAHALAYAAGWEIATGPVMIWVEVAHIKGDLDNRAKVLLDCLSGVLWKDDEQIVEAHWRVLRVHHRNEERALLTVATVDGLRTETYIEWRERWHS